MTIEHRHGPSATLARLPRANVTIEHRHQPNATLARPTRANVKNEHRHEPNATLSHAAGANFKMQPLECDLQFKRLNANRGTAPGRPRWPSDDLLRRRLPFCSRRFSDLRLSRDRSSGPAHGGHQQAGEYAYPQERGRQDE